MENKPGSENLAGLEQAFFNDGYRIALENIHKEDIDANLGPALQELYSVLDSFINMFLKQAVDVGSPAHCARGCSWCCHQAVFAQAYEIKYLKAWMFENLSAEMLDQIRKKAKEKKARTTKLSQEDRLLHKEACPLLWENACLAYMARPVACRIYLSSDVDSCKYEFHHPEDKSVFPQLFDLTLRAGRRLNEGFGARLSELGYDVKEYALEEGVYGL